MSTETAEARISRTPVSTGVGSLYADPSMPFVQTVGDRLVAQSQNLDSEWNALRARLEQITLPDDVKQQVGEFEGHVRAMCDCVAEIPAPDKDKVKEGEKRERSRG